MSEQLQDLTRDACGCEPHGPGLVGIACPCPCHSAGPFTEAAFMKAVSDVAGRRHLRSAGDR